MALCNTHLMKEMLCWVYPNVRQSLRDTESYKGPRIYEPRKDCKAFAAPELCSV